MFSIKLFSSVFLLWSFAVGADPVETVIDAAKKSAASENMIIIDKLDYRNKGCAIAVAFGGTAEIGESPALVKRNYEAVLNSILGGHVESCYTIAGDNTQTVNCPITFSTDAGKELQLLYAWRQRAGGQVSILVCIKN